MLHAFNRTWQSISRLVLMTSVVCGMSGCTPQLKSLVDEHEVKLQEIKKWQDGGKQGRRPWKRKDPAKGALVRTTLFNGMVNPVIPYGIKGAIWYQGESNSGNKAAEYAVLFEAMVKGYNKLIDVLKSKYEPEKAGGVSKEKVRKAKSKAPKKTNSSSERKKPD